MLKLFSQQKFTNIHYSDLLKQMSSKLTRKTFVFLNILIVNPKYDIFAIKFFSEISLQIYFKSIRIKIWKIKCKFKGSASAVITGNGPHNSNPIKPALPSLFDK